MWFCRSVGHDLAMIFQFPAQHIKATSQTRINLINLYCSCHSDGSSFPSSSSCLTSAISASVSRVLWEGTQVYPEEVKGEWVEKASDSLEAFPCSWWFTLQNIFFLLFVSCEVTSLMILYCSLRHWKESYFLNWGVWQSPACQGWGNVWLGFVRKQRFPWSWT